MALLVTRHDGTIFTNPESVTVDFEITILRANNTATTTTNTTTNSTTNTTNSTTTTLLQSSKDQKNIPVYGHPSFYEIPEFSEQYKEKKTLTVNGFLSLEVNVPENAKRIEILATVMNMTRGVTVLRSDSLSGNFLHLLLTSRNPEVGQVVEFTARTTEPVKSITYQVYAKGTMVFESEVTSPVEAGNQTFSISFTLTPVMAPHCRVLAFYLRDNGEVVPDSLSINVKATLDNPVDVGFTAETAKPGDTVNLVISAKPNTTVFLLSADKNVQLLKSGNDITQEMITEELVSYDYSFMFYGFWYDMFLSGFPYPSKGSDANKVFKDADVVILTDGLVYDNQYTRYPNFVMASFPRKIVQAAVSPVSGVRRISKNVPETWLWNMVTIGSSGKYTLSEVAPNAIVTWQTTAIAVHPVFGLSVTPKAAEITTYPSVFVTLDTPDTAMRGEDICFKAFAFNYYNTSLELTLTMGSIDGIQVSKEGQKSTNLSHSLGQVDPDNVRDTDFCFTPVKLGPLPVRVNLTTTSVPGDSVEQIILVKPEGKPKAVKQ
ncbi:C3 and PZP-like alpha-2-macroglobulin domain-containing protein 8 [Pomacea canaliculata]|uniref:C3 and PZP-like alpha-2-macroglobulin domain-containing protein 8 n=1 Tax=Pomacea canaliculata TaxID=400727 RepID=UPI000D72A300|nr:C3 and PZP-like alpha-2-macroglobulin domain-containing protein 8 [Pomacea canaliculata]